MLYQEQLQKQSKEWTGKSSRPTIFKKQLYLDRNSAQDKILNEAFTKAYVVNVWIFYLNFQILPLLQRHNNTLLLHYYLASQFWFNFNSVKSPSESGKQFAS